MNGFECHYENGSSRSRKGGREDSAHLLHESEKEPEPLEMYVCSRNEIREVLPFPTSSR